MKSINVTNIIVIISTLFLILPVSLYAGTYWVDANGGAANWAACEGSDPGGNNRCSMAQANANADDDDIVNLMTGTYGTGIVPANSGSSGHIITYQKHTGETPTITGAFTGINLNGRSYIKINGITITNIDRMAALNNGSHYNEIVNCTIGPATIAGMQKGDAGVMLRDVNGPDYATHNWIHDCTIYGVGYVSDGGNDAEWLIKVGDDTTGDQDSSYNTFEDNILYWGGHHVLRVCSRYNIIRNNVFHNEGWMQDPRGRNSECTAVNTPYDCCTGNGTGTCNTMTTTYKSDANDKFGNRNLNLVDYNNTSGGLYNLIEENRIGHAGPPPDDDGSNSLVIFSPKNILRYNSIFGAGQMGVYFRATSSDNNRFYNNSIYYNGYDAINAYDDDGGIIVDYRGTGNQIKNNINYNNESPRGDWRCLGGGCTGVDQYNTLANNWDTTDGDPKFTNTDISDPTSTTLPDMSLQSDSDCIDNGGYLTQANGDGSSSVTLIVDDALYFQDGSWGSSLSNIQADHIAIGTVGNTVQISSINYVTNTITLASAMTWSNNANIWLYKKSDGTLVLYGSAPDIGASEFGVETSSCPATPQRLSAQ